MNITKCLTISTAHITGETAEKLDQNFCMGEIDLAVYDKGDYGWWIYIGNDLKDIPDGLPDDLMQCIALAYAYDCEWLCLDQAAEEVYLPVYEW